MLCVYSLEQAEQWDYVVQTFRDYNVYYLSGYVKAFKIHGDGEPLLFFYDGVGKEGIVRGINIVMKRDISCDPHFSDKIEKGKLFDFSTPYGYGGWLIEGEDVEQLFNEYEQWCQENGIISEFVRFHPIVKNYIYNTKYYNVKALGETIAMDLTSVEVIWKNISSKNRNVIRKAIKSGVKIYNGRYPEIYERFREIYNNTMDKNNADPYYYFKSEFYNSILNDLSKNAQIFYAQIPDGTIIAASIIVGANGILNYHLSGFLQEYGSLAATNLLLYEVALWGNANGYKLLYLGGGVGAGEDNLFKFKRAFYKGELYKFYIGKKIFNEKYYGTLIRMREHLPQSDFFPRYKA